MRHKPFLFFLLALLGMGLSRVAHAEEFSPTELNRLAALYGRPANWCAQEKVPVYETMKSFDTSLVLEAEAREGIKELHLVARGKLPAKTQVGRNEKTGEILGVCTGGFKVEGPQFVTSKKSSPKRETKKEEVIPADALRKVEISGNLGLSGKLHVEVEHDLSPNLQRNLDRITEEFTRRNIILRSEVRPCFGISTWETIAGSALFTFGATSYNPDAKAGDQIVSAAAALFGAALAGHGFYLHDSDRACEIAGLVVGAAGGTLVGINNRPEDKRDRDPGSQATPVQPPPAPPPSTQPGGVPAPPSPFDPPG